MRAAKSALEGRTPPLEPCKRLLGVAHELVVQAGVILSGTLAGREVFLRLGY
jgi:hypothetical protein